MPRGTNPKAVDLIFDSRLAIRTAWIGPTPGRRVHTIKGSGRTDEFHEAGDETHSGAVSYPPCVNQPCLYDIFWLSERGSNACRRAKHAGLGYGDHPYRTCGQPTSEQCSHLAVGHVERRGEQNGQRSDEFQQLTTKFKDFPISGSEL